MTGGYTSHYTTAEVSATLQICSSAVTKVLFTDVCPPDWLRYVAELLLATEESDTDHDLDEHEPAFLPASLQDDNKVVTSPPKHQQQPSVSSFRAAGPRSLGLSWRRGHHQRSRESSRDLQYDRSSRVKLRECHHAWTCWGLSPGPSACEADVIPLHHMPLSTLTVSSGGRACAITMCHPARRPPVPRCQR